MYYNCGHNSKTHGKKAAAREKRQAEGEALQKDAGV